MQNRQELGYALADAVDASNEKFVKRLIDGKANVMLKYADGNQILHLAMAPGKRNPNIVKMLLEAKASPDVRNNKNNTILDGGDEDRYKDENYWNCIRVFIESLEGKNLGNVLYHAVFADRFDIVKELFIARPDPDLSAYEIQKQNNLLHLAVIKNNPSMIFSLLEHGINPEILNKDKKTAIALARESKKTDCVNAFAVYGSFVALLDAARADIESLSNGCWSIRELKIFRQLLSQIRTYSDTLILFNKEIENNRLKDPYYYQEFKKLLKKYYDEFIKLGNEEPLIPVTNAAAKLLDPKRLQQPLKDSETIKEIEPEKSLDIQTSKLPSQPLAAYTRLYPSLPKSPLPSAPPAPVAGEGEDLQPGATQPDPGAEKIVLSFK